MKKVVVSLALGLMVCGASTAMAANTTGLYLGGFGGVSVGGESSATEITGFDIDYKTGYVFGVNFGYKDSSGLRPEIEMNYRAADIDSLHDATGPINGGGAVSSFNTLINLYFDIKNSSPVTPYVGGGIGVAVPFVKGYTGNVMTANAAFAYQFGAGATYDLTTKVGLDFGYRYAGFTRTSYGTNGELDNHSHNIQIGAFYRF